VILCFDVESLLSYRSNVRNRGFVPLSSPGR
jgi:hypothetical protein